MIPRELLLDVLGALDVGICRVASVSVHIHSVPREVEDEHGHLRPGTWRDGIVSVESIPDSRRGSGEPCEWPPMTIAEALHEAGDIIEHFRSQVAPERIANARELLARAAASAAGSAS